MNYTDLKMLLILSAFWGISCSEDDCVWKYKCCAFKEIDGQVQCVKMCEPQVTCQTSDVVEIFEEKIDDNRLADYSIRGVCRTGYQFHNGRCRRIFGKIKENI